VQSYYVNGGELAGFDKFSPILLFLGELNPKKESDRLLPKKKRIK